MSRLSLALACAVVRRRRANDAYSPKDYQICLEENGDTFCCPSIPADYNAEPAKVILNHVKSKMKLTATQVHAIKAYGKPVEGVKDHVITTLYAVPVALDDTITGKYRFHDLADVLEDRYENYKLKQNHRNMLYCLDQWLRERHTIPFINLDLLFLCSREGEGVGGLVKAVIENPLHNARVRPPEDNLVISLNNPVFDTSNGLPNSNA